MLKFIFLSNLISCLLVGNQQFIERDKIEETVETVHFIKKNSLSRMIKVLEKNSDLQIIDISKAVVDFCKHSHTSPNDALKFSWENVDSMRREAQERRDQALLDSLKVIEEVLHMKPGHAIEEGRCAYREFKESYEGYRMAEMMEGYLERGEYEKWHNGVFLGKVE